MSGKPQKIRTITGNKWFPIAEQRKDTDGSFRWVPLDDCPFFHADAPLARVRKEVKRGNLIMATRKVRNWHYELVVKIPKTKMTVVK